MRDLDRERSKVGDRIRHVIAALLVLSGTVTLAWVAVLLIDARWSQEAARRTLDSAAPPESPRPRTTDEPPASSSLVLPRSSIGELLIPRLHMSAIILHGSDAKTLRRGPGHIERTSFPGDVGNVAIAGHRDTFFRQLRDVRIGDDVFINTPRRHVHYRVASTRVVNAHDLSVLEPTENGVLTLITCYPFWVLGPAPDRFVVRATLVEDGTLPTWTLSRPIMAAAISAVPTVHSPTTVARANEAVAGVAPLASPPATTTGDDALVRQAIARLIAAYNAQLARHDVFGNRVQVSDCRVMLRADAAEATCSRFGESPRERSEIWTLALERAGGVWTIRSMTVADSLADNDDAEAR